MIKNVKAAFTLAEVLITLGIIGVVAALTMPSLIANHQKKVVTSKLKKVYSTLYNAYNSAQLDNGSSETWNYPQNTENFTVQNFWDMYFAPYIKAEKYSTYNYDVKNLNGGDASSKSDIFNRAVKTRTPDGTCIFMWGNNQFLTITVDINCDGKPNVVGKDIFDIAELYWSSKKFIIPAIGELERGDARKDIINLCASQSYQGGQPARCFGVFVYDGWVFKDDYPW